MKKESKKFIRVCFGQKIRALRQAKAVSQEELGALAGVHRTYIGMVERGEKNVTLITLLRLADALDATPAELLEEFGNGK